MAKAAQNAERSAFLRDLKKRQTELAEAAKKEVASGFMSDEEIIEALGLEGDTRRQFGAKVARVRYGLDKHKEPYFAFNFVATDEDIEALTVSQFFGLGGKNKADRLKKDERLCGNFQRLNVDTTKWKPAEVSTKMVEAADELTKTKPAVRLSAYLWGDDNDRLGIDIIGVGGPSKNKTKDEVEEEDEESQYEDVDAHEEEEDTEDYNSWLEYECTFEYEGETISGTITEWDEGNGMFTVVDENGDEYPLPPEELSFDE